MGGANSIKWLNYLIPHVVSKFHSIYKMLLNFKCLHKTFLGFYKIVKTMLGWPNFFWGTKSVKGLSSWISLNACVLISKTWSLQIPFHRKYSRAFYVVKQCFSQLFIFLRIIFISRSWSDCFKGLTYWFSLTVAEFEKSKCPDSVILKNVYINFLQIILGNVTSWEKPIL